MADTRWLDEREQRAWRGLQGMHMRLNGELARDLAQGSNISYPDYEVLVMLTDHDEDPMRLFELGEILGWEKSRLSHHLARMVERGLVEKVPCDTDRRGAFVQATSRGRRAIEAAAPGHVAAVRRLFIDHLSPSELDTLGNAAEKVLAVLTLQ